MFHFRFVIHFAEDFHFTSLICHVLLVTMYKPNTNKVQRTKEMRSVNRIKEKKIESNKKLKKKMIMSGANVFQIEKRLFVHIGCQSRRFQLR